MTAPVTIERVPVTRTYALCRDGFVADVRTVMDTDVHPFAGVALRHPRRRIDPRTEHVVETGGVPCAVGYLVDGYGNFAPAGARVEPLGPGEAAYHDRRVVPALPIAHCSKELWK